MPVPGVYRKPSGKSTCRTSETPKPDRTSGGARQTVNPATDSVSAVTTVRVAVAVPLDRAFDYSVAGHGPLSRGAIVEVPFGPRRRHGIVLGPGAGDVPQETLKAVTEIVALPPLEPRFVDFLERVAAWTMAPIGSVAKMALSQPLALQPPPQRKLFRRPQRPPEGERLTAARHRVAEFLGVAGAMPSAELQREAGVSAAVITGMQAAGSLEAVLVSDEPPPAPARAGTGPKLSEDQRAAAAEVAARLGKGFSSFLLDGVTGSGKTEVYFDAVRRTLDAGRQVLILLPEIALSAAWKQRFQDRFGVMPVEWHSDVAPGRKRRAWRHAHTGAAQVVVGARSALFLPFARLGLIVVDEEHE